MENLKYLHRTCSPNRAHLYQVPLVFSGFVRPFEALYRCPICGRTRVFKRCFRGGPIVRVDNRAPRPFVPFGGASW